MATGMYSGTKGIPMAEFQDVAAAFGKHQVALEMHAAIKTSLAKVLKEGKFEAADIKPLFKGNKLDADINLMLLVLLILILKIKKQLVFLILLVSLLHLIEYQLDF